MESKQYVDINKYPDVITREEGINRIFHNNDNNTEYHEILLKSRSHGRCYKLCCCPCTVISKIVSVAFNFLALCWEGLTRLLCCVKRKTDSDYPPVGEVDGYSYEGDGCYVLNSDNIANDKRSLGISQPQTKYEGSSTSSSNAFNETLGSNNGNDERNGTISSPFQGMFDEALGSNNGKNEIYGTISPFQRERKVDTSNLD